MKPLDWLVIMLIAVGALSVGVWFEARSHIQPPPSVECK